MLASKPGSPDSATVGTSGSPGHRLAAAMARALSFPLASTLGTKRPSVLHSCIDVAAQQVGHNGGAAAVLGVSQFDLGALLQELSGDVTEGTVSGKARGHLVGISLRIIDHLLERLCRKIRSRNNDDRRFSNEHDRGEIPLRIKRQIFVHQLVCGGRAGGREQQGMAIGLCLRHDSCP